MPTSRISAGILAGLGSGVQRGGQAFAMGDQAFEQGRDQAMNLQSQLAQRLAATQLAQQEVADKQRAASNQAPDALQRIAMTGNNIPLEAAEDVTDFLQRGKLNAKYDALPADQAGPALPRPGWEANLQPMARNFAALNTAVALGDKSTENVAKATQIARTSALSDAVLAGRQDPTKLAQAEYAAKGSAPYKSDEWGVTNMLNGTVDVSGAPAQGFAQKRQSEIRENDAQAGSARASAANSYAAAGQHRAATDKIRQELQAATEGTGKGSLASPKDRFDAENKLRDEYQKQTGTFSKVRDAYSKMNAAATDPNAASDIALIFAYMKMLDPDSVVREGEFATAQNAGGIPDRVVNMYNRAVDGTRLNPVQRKNFLGEGEKVYKSQAQGLDQTTKNYGEMADRYKLDVRNIVTPFAPVERAPAAGAPAAAAPARIQSDADFAALPSGARFVGPDGKTRVKP